MDRSPFLTMIATLRSAGSAPESVAGPPFSLTALLQGYSLELGALYGLVRIRTVHARPGPVFTCWEVKSVYLERLNL